MHIFRGVLKEYKDGFVALNVDVSDFGYQSAHKVAATLCASGCTVVPPTIFICLRIVRPQNFKSR